MGKRNIRSAISSFFDRSVYKILIRDVIIIGIVTIGNFGCLYVKKSQQEYFQESTIFVTHDAKCETVRGIVLGLDKDFQFSKLHRNQGRIEGNLLVIDSKKKIKQYFIYSIDKIQCKYRLIGKSDDTGHFNIAIDENKSYGFVASELNGETDEYLFCFDIIYSKVD